MTGALPTDRATRASTEPASSLGHSAGIPSARKWRLPNHVKLGPVIIRIGGRGLAPWGYPRLQIGGLSFWSRCNNGDLHFAGYHPRRSITWLWYVGITKRSRGYYEIFSKAEIKRRAILFVTGNPFVGPTRWFHRFWQPDYRRKGQWHDYLRLPFGRMIVIGHQEAMPAPQAPHSHGETQ